MNSTLSDSRQKIVWGVLILGLVTIGSVWVWQKFGGITNVGAPFMAPDPTGRDESRPYNGTNAASLLPTYGEAPDFTFTERSGRAFSKSELLGKPWIADFIFTSCAGQCPFMSSEMSKLQGLFSKETPMQFVSFTVDPKRDTPEVLSEYAERYGAEKERWFFLTGSPEEIDRILKGFFLSPVEEPAMHSLYFILVDEKGALRGYYDSSEAGAIKRLIRDAKILTRSS